MKTPFTTALAGISAVALADTHAVSHVMQENPNTDLTHEICSRAVDRLLVHNIDFNTVLEENTGAWTDPQFKGWERLYWKDYRPAKLGSDEDLSGHEEIIEWKRIKDTFNTGEYSMWGSEGIDFSDPGQGSIGDCWLIAASSVVAQDPSRIKTVFLTEDLNSAGVYAVQLYMLGIPVTVTVDDYLPFYAGTWSGKDLLYASVGPDKSLWMPILEKAGAKLFGSYEHLVAGRLGPAIQTLTGAPYYKHAHSDYSVDGLWDMINEKFSQKWMVTCQSFQGAGSDKQQNDIGIPYMHAFTINGTKQLSDGTKLIRIRNPWGSETYKGPFSDKGEDDERWTTQFKFEADFIDEDDGLWWTTAQDFHESMAGTTMNPDVADSHMSYFAQFEIERGIEHVDELLVTSDVAQTIYMSAYTYDSQHDGNVGQGCADFREGSSSYITHDRAAGGEYVCFTWSKEHHYEGIEMSAGEVLRV